MLKIENAEVVGWEHAIRGMRNPLNSWKKSDSRYVCPYKATDAPICGNCTENPCIGPNDLDLMRRLANAGTDHRKFMRMIVVYCNITAPLYWWKEFDTYKVGTVANSCSTMHKIAAKEFTLEDFSCEHLFDEDSLPPYEERVDIEHCEPLAAIDVNGQWCYYTPKTFVKMTCNVLNHFRDLYLKTKDKEYWWQMIQLLPSSYNQRRTVMLNYEVLANIYKSRRNHRLDEWAEHKNIDIKTLKRYYAGEYKLRDEKSLADAGFCDWIKTLPCSELITGPSLKDIPICNEIMEEAKRRVREELDAKLNKFYEIHKGMTIQIPKESVSPEAMEIIEKVLTEDMSLGFKED